MSNLVERLRTAARKACQRHNGIDQFDPTWQLKPKDFIEWEAAEEIAWLRGVIGTLDCLDPFTCGRGDYLCPSCEEDRDG